MAGEEGGFGDGGNDGDGDRYWVGYGEGDGYV